MLIKRPIDDALAPLLTQAGSAAPRADEPHPPVPGGRYVPAPSLRPVPSFTPTQPPQPADEVELDQLRYGLRAAQLKVVQESDRLNGLQRARVRARSERYGAIERFAEAERVLADAKRHGRAHLVALYVDGKELAGPTPENAEHERNLRADQVRSAETLIEALDGEIDGCEAGLVGHRRRRDEAAGAVVSRSGEFLRLLHDIQAAFATLRSARLAIREVSKLVSLESRLRDLALVDQPSDGNARYPGYRVNEGLVTIWTQAVAALLADADAPLPKTAGSGLTQQRLCEVRAGGAAQPARPRAQGGG